jgi:hypothetical protein
MTDEREPTIETQAADDVTSRVPTSDPNPGSAPSVPPTAPLTPASPSTAVPTGFEHEVAWSSGPVAASPVVPPAKPPRTGGRLRWAVSLGVIALVIVASAAVAAIITGRSSTAVVLGYVPTGTTAYAEVRLDLPGDQRAAVGGFLSKFPGFADQAALDSKLDEVLDQLVKDATNDEQSYTANIKPWFDGELAFSVGPLPPAPAASSDGAQLLGSSRALALVSIKDQALAQAWFDAAIAKTGAKTTSQVYNGATLTVFEPTDGVTFALAMIDGKVATAGDIASVKAAVDSKGSSGFASEPGPKAALDSVKDDYVGFGYVALRPLLDWSNSLNKAQGSALGGVAMEGISDALLKTVPEWTAYWLRFEKDALVMEASAPRAESATGPTENRSSTIVEHVPSSAILAATNHDLGKSVKEMLDLYRTDASAKPIIDQLDQGLDLVGGPDAAFGWARDSAIVVDAANGTPEGGLIVEATDPDAAKKLFTALRTFITLGGDQVGATVSDETYNGTTITTISLSDLGKLSGMAGGSTGALPVPINKIDIAYAVTDKVVVIGSGPGFVKAVLDTTPSTSLASNETYKTLADRAGTGTGGSYVDLEAVRGLIEKAAADGTADAAELKNYETDVKPFLVPFDAMFATGSIDGDLTRSVIYITVK